MCKTDKFLSGILAVILTGFCYSIYLAATHRITDADIAATKAKYGCVATNEFVGKDADRLYLCADGLKYKSGAFYGVAYEEKFGK